MKHLITFLLSLVLPAVVMAQSDISQDTGIIGSGRYQGAQSANGQVTVPVLGVTSSNNTAVNAMSGQEAQLTAAKTPIAGASQSKGLTLKIPGTGYNYAPYVPTLAATPVDGTNIFKPGLNVAPTVAANAAGCMGAVPSAGDTYEIINSGPNAIRAKACGTPGVNGGAAGTYISIGTMQKATCNATSPTNYNCDFGTVPTPAGP